MDFVALCLTDFIDWRYIQSWSTQLVNCCPHGQRNYACVLLPLYLLSDWGEGGGGGGVELCV
jgi:hypothetical protein